MKSDQEAMEELSGINKEIKKTASIKESAKVVVKESKRNIRPIVATMGVGAVGTASWFFNEAISRFISGDMVGGLQDVGLFLVLILGSGFLSFAKSYLPEKDLRSINEQGKTILSSSDSVNVFSNGGYFLSVTMLFWGNWPAAILAFIYGVYLHINKFLFPKGKIEEIFEHSIENIKG